MQAWSVFRSVLTKSDSPDLQWRDIPATSPGLAQTVLKTIITVFKFVSVIQEQTLALSFDLH